MNKGLLFLVFFIFISLSKCQELLQEPEVFEEFENFRRQFNKTYSSIEEFNKRYQIFKKNFYIKERLAASEKNQTKLKESSLGLTRFMDMSPEDFSKDYLLLKSSEIPEKAQKYFDNSVIEDSTEEDEEGIDDVEDEVETQGRFLQATRKKIPKHWDWRKHGAVQEIQTQGVCGGCWAFTAISNIESQYFRKYGVLPKFSEQQLIDCDGSNSGCAGGIMHNAYNYLQQYGVAQNQNYPYRESDGYCTYQPFSGAYVVAGYKFAGTTDEAKIKKMLFKEGPLGITINANLLQYYTGGVLDVPYEQCPYAPNHGVNLVGYGTTKDGQKYWIVRNTWGTSWGEQGYFRIARGKGLCGVNMYVITAFIN